MATGGGRGTELLRLRTQVAEMDKDVTCLGKAAAYFATNSPRLWICVDGHRVGERDGNIACCRVIRASATTQSGFHFRV